MKKIQLFLIVLLLVANQLQAQFFPKSTTTTATTQNLVLSTQLTTLYRTPKEINITNTNLKACGVSYSKNHRVAISLINTSTVGGEVRIWNSMDAFYNGNGPNKIFPYTNATPEALVFDDNDNLYVACPNKGIDKYNYANGTWSLFNTITVYEPSTQGLSKVGNPRGLAFYNSSSLLVLCENLMDSLDVSNVIRITNLNTQNTTKQEVKNSKLSTNQALGIAYNKARNKFIVSELKAGKVYTYDYNATTNEFTNKITVPYTFTSVTDVASSPTSSYVYINYVENGNCKIKMYSVYSGTLKDFTIPTSLSKGTVPNSICSMSGWLQPWGIVHTGANIIVSDPVNNRFLIL